MQRVKPLAPSLAPSPPAEHRHHRTFQPFTVLCDVPHKPAPLTSGRGDYVSTSRFRSHRLSRSFPPRATGDACPAPDALGSLVNAFRPHGHEQASLCAQRATLSGRGGDTGVPFPPVAPLHGRFIDRSVRIRGMGRILARRKWCDQYCLRQSCRAGAHFPGMSSDSALTVALREPFCRVIMLSIGAGSSAPTMRSYQQVSTFLSCRLNVPHCQGVSGNHSVCVELVSSWWA